MHVDISCALPSACMCWVSWAKCAAVLPPSVHLIRVFIPHLFLGDCQVLPRFGASWCRVGLSLIQINCQLCWNYLSRLRAMNLFRDRLLLEVFLIRSGFSIDLIDDFFRWDLISGQLILDDFRQNDFLNCLRRLLPLSGLFRPFLVVHAFSSNLSKKLII